MGGGTGISRESGYGRVGGEHHMNLIIPRDLAQAIMNYLITKPYAEVFQFIEHLKMLKETNEKSVSEEKPR
jgi:hypothetical protein